MRRILASVVLVACGLSGCASLPTTGVADVSGIGVAYARAGQGRPPIVLQSGLGDDRSAWTDVFRLLQARHTVLVYDRPGYGDSKASARPRDPCTIAAETRALLSAAGLQPPFVLVGHSLGGLYQFVYARLYPDEVAGLVLLDPTHPRHWETLQREAPAAAATLWSLRHTVFNAAARREFDQQADCLDRVEVRPTRAIPVQILVSTRRSGVEGRDFQEMLARLQADWRRLSGATSVDPVDGSGHYIQRDAPEAVVRAIEGLVRGQGSR